MVLAAGYLEQQKAHDHSSLPHNFADLVLQDFKIAILILMRSVLFISSLNAIE